MSDMAKTFVLSMPESARRPEADHPATDATALRRRMGGTTMRHVAAISAISDELGKPYDEIASAYQRELVHMAAHARVVDFLPILVTKRLLRLYAIPNATDAARVHGKPFPEPGFTAPQC